MGDRTERALAYLVLMLGWALRLFWLVESPIWYDESFTLVHSLHGPWRALLALGQLDNAPPLYGMLLSLWIALFGSQEFVVRFFSAFLGIATLPLVGRWAGEITGRRIEWGPMLFVATCPIFVRYTYEVRMYSLGISLAAAFGWLTWRLLTGRLVRTWSYVLTGLAMLLAHVYTGFLWAVLLAIGAGAWAARRLPHAGLWLRANLLLGLGALPIAAWMLWRARLDATAYGPIPFTLDLPRWLPHQYGLTPFLADPWGQLAMAALVLSVVLGAVQLLVARNWRALGFVAMGLSLPVVLLLLAGQVKGKWGPQYLLFSWGLALAIAAGTAWRARATHGRWGRWIAAAGLILALAWTALAVPSVAAMNRGEWRMLRDEFNPRPDFRAVGRYIEAHDAPGDVILVVNGIAAHTLEYYYRGEAPVLGLPETFVLDTRHPVDLRQLRLVEQRIGPAQRLWLLLWINEFVDPNNQVLDTLLERCQRLPVGENFQNAALLLFDLRGCRPLDDGLSPPEPLSAGFGPLELLGYRLSVESGRISLSLWWAAREAVGVDYSAFVHLVRDGELIGQDDRLLGTFRFPTSLWEPGTVIKTRHQIALPADDCVGCALYVGLYDSEELLRGGRLGRVLLADGSDHLSLALPLDPTYTEPWPLDEQFGPLRLTGYRLSTEGGAVSLLLWWRAEAPMEVNYAAFVHLLRPGGTVGQDDRALGGDGFPTSLWEPGVSMRTRHRIPLPPEGCAECWLRIGIYDYQAAMRTGGEERVSRPDGSTFLEIPLP